jgi:hypothetical protein
VSLHVFLTIGTLDRFGGRVWQPNLQRLWRAY